MDKDELWQEVRTQLRKYVVMRGWNMDFIVAHLNLKPERGRETVALWLGDIRRPAGNHLIALWYMLHELGFSAPGISRLSPEVRFAGRLFAFGAARQEDICLQAFSLHGTAQEFYRILRGAQAPKQLTDLGSKYRSDLRSCINEAIAREQEVVASAVSIRHLVAAQL